MGWRRGWATWRWLGLLAVVQGSGAWALSCKTPAPAIFPPDEATGVPTNVVLRVLGTGLSPAGTGSLDGATLRLTAGGVEVPLVITTGPGFGLSAKPVTELRPLTEYDLHVTGDGLAAPVDSEFRTGSAPDSTPPSPPVIDGSSSCRDPKCTYENYTFALSGASDESTPSVILQVFTGAAVDSIDLSRPRAEIPASAPRLTAEACASNLDLSATHLAVAMRAIDWGGNASPVSTGVQLKSAACSSAPSLPLVLLGLLGLGLRRRG